MLFVTLSYKINSESEMTKSSGSTDSVEVCLGVLGHVEVDDHVNGKDIDTSGENIRADETSSFSIFEIVVDSKKS